MRKERYLKDYCKIFTNMYEDKVLEIVNKIVKEYDPEKIILFGSYAWDNPGPDSDVDLFVIKEVNISRRERQLRLRHLLLDFDLPADILAYTSEEINQRLALRDFFIKNVINKGKIVYE